MKKIEGQFCYPIHPIPSHPEVKHFQDFKKANFRLLIVSVKHPSLDTIKWKKYQMDPIRDLLSKVPSGDIALCKMLAHATTPPPPPLPPIKVHHFDQRFSPLQYGCYDVFLSLTTLVTLHSF